MSEDKETIKRLEEIVKQLYDELTKLQIPSISVSLRTKGNIVFDKNNGIWTYGKMKSTRSAKTLDGAKMLLRTLYAIELINKMIEERKSSTLREMYYISEGWGLGKFNAQDESDRLVEDLEIITKSLREDFKLRPEENGASVIGNITIEETNRAGQRKRINCRDDVGDSGYTIPYNVEKSKIRFLDWDADFIIGIESGGMFDRLVENGFDEEGRAILIHLKGQPARCTRRLMKRMNEECKLPVLLFTDCDPWSFRIFASVAYGAIKTAYISSYLACPSAQFLGVIPSDIENYDLPSDKLTDEDVKALNAELSDPRFKGQVLARKADGNDIFWEDEIKMQLQLNKKSEQQSLAKYGLDYVTDRYLPDKLAELGIG
ncbi:MAG: DNA topoisomerase IV subunit A [Candidatus Thermoplasmatota archaeon]